MTREEYRQAILDTAYLAACAVNGTIPERERTDTMDLDAVCRASRAHLLSCIAALSLEKAGIRNDELTQEIGKGVRKAVAFDAERTAVFGLLEESGIWYMPLKGSVLKELYPAEGMREMSDVDVLFDASRCEDVRKIMESRGFTTVQYDQGPHDGYHKEPIYCFEMHRSLFGDAHSKPLSEYYGNFENHLLKDDGNGFGYHLSDEDLYVYMIAHEYKHYKLSGTGLRSLLDTYVFLKERGPGMDWQYVDGEISKLGMTDFEKSNRELAERLFSGETLSAENAEMLDYIVYSGTYGTEGNRINNLLHEKGRAGYLLSRAFLPYRSMKVIYPVLKKAPVLLPFCWIARWIGALVNKPKRAYTQFKAAFKRDV